MVGARQLPRKPDGSLDEFVAGATFVAGRLVRRPKAKHRAAKEEL